MQLLSDPPEGLRDIRVEDLELSVRTANALRNWHGSGGLDLATLHGLATVDLRVLAGLKGFGAKAIQEIRDAVRFHPEVRRLAVPLPEEDEIGRWARINRHLIVDLVEGRLALVPTARAWREREE